MNIKFMVLWSLAFKGAQKGKAYIGAKIPYFTTSFKKQLSFQLQRSRGRGAPGTRLLLGAVWCRGAVLDAAPCRPLPLLAGPELQVRATSCASQGLEMRVSAVRLCGQSQPHTLAQPTELMHAMQAAFTAAFAHPNTNCA